MKAIISRIKRFTLYAMRTHALTYKDTDFILTSEVKSRPKDVKPHTYWNREIIWLMLLYYYE
jgi:hypothetical protein